MLEEDDAQQLDTLSRVMMWNQVPIDVTDEGVVAMAESVNREIQSSLLREVAIWRIELRTVVAAIRRRAAGKPAPTRDQVWGYGRWVRQLVDNWSQTDFGLSGPMPWITDFNERIEKMDALGFERALLHLVWTYLSRKAEGHYFDFEAVVLYVERWDVTRRWTLHNSTEAARRFEELMQASWGAYADQLEAAVAAGTR